MRPSIIFQIANGSDDAIGSNRQMHATVARIDYANEVLNRLADSAPEVIPDGFLNHHSETRSPYTGAFLEIVETDEYSSVNACGKAILEKI